MPVERYKLNVVFFVVCVVALWVALALDINHYANEQERIDALTAELPVIPKL